MRKKLMALTGQLDGILLLISALFLLLSTLLSVVNAIMRFGNLGGIVWAEEVSTLLMILLVFLAIPSLEFNDQQLCISVLQSSLKNKNTKRFFHILRGIVTIVFTGIMLWFCFKVTQNAFAFQYTTQVLHIPRYCLYTFMLISYVCVILSWLVTIFAGGGWVRETAVDLGVVDESSIDAHAADSMLNTKTSEQKNQGDGED